MSDTDIGPMQELITSKLTESLSPQYLSVINESYKHNVPKVCWIGDSQNIFNGTYALFLKGSESHFNVTVVSEAFQGIS